MQHFMKCETEVLFVIANRDLSLRLKGSSLIGK